MSVPALLQAHEANSHSKQGWEKFTDAVIEHLSQERKHLVFLLWGKHAQVCLGGSLGSW